ncbi:hypothetical protein GCM10007913_14860 [Devosia yakushimensis]|uniref:MBL fold metallo-hydrolase n=1 Tax=Devosia yakushimensis TaxID=470028 RepID=A0ABQ5UCG9_9HYPH|nr:hypothetical protein [Devosia yakushimensis]GLQ09554.1 hypothetical protein GCM10007913_14860 [Devosia yakushimensis]
MKLTWFGGTTLRIHIGGQILVMDAGAAPEGIDAAELVSGADMQFESHGNGLADVDAAGWKPRRPARLLDEGKAPEVIAALRAGQGAVLVDAVGEPPLLLVTDTLPVLGRWADDAVVVLLGDGERIAALGQALLEASPPKLLVLGGKESDVDMAVAALRDRLDGTGLMALEPAMALEV